MPDQDSMLAKIRALLAKAEAEGCTPPEAELLTAKAAELMAKYGIDRARLGALHPETDKLSSKIIDCPNPWGQVHAHLLCGVAAALRCQVVLLGTRAGGRVHVFGYESDLERTELLYTSLMLQMASALRVTGAPGGARPPFLEGGRLKAWNRSWLLGFSSAVTYRLKAAEQRATQHAEQEDAASSGPSTALVLADRSVAVKAQVQQEYTNLRPSRITYSGRGYRDGHAAGQRADIGGTRVGAGSGRAISR
jgi:hypothetical protein